MSKAPTKPIDGDKLRELLLAKHPSLNQASRDFGYGNNFFSNILARGSITNATATLIELKLGIPYESYKAVEEPQTPAVEPVQPTGLREIDVEMAVFHGIMRAVDYLQEDVQALVYKAVYGALKKINADKEGSVKVSA